MYIFRVCAAVVVISMGVSLFCLLAFFIKSRHKKSRFNFFIIFLTCAIVSFSVILIFTDFPTCFSSMNYRDLLYYGIIFFVSIGVSFSPKILLPIMLFIVGLYQFSIYFTINKFCLSYTEPALITVSEEFIEVNHPFAKFSLEALPSNNYETEQNIEIFLEKVSIDPHRFIFTHPYFYSITGISIGDFKSLSYDYGLTKFDLFLLGIVGEESKPNEMTTDVTDRYMVASIKKQFKNFQFNLFVKYSEKFSFTIENIL